MLVGVSLSAWVGLLVASAAPLAPDVDSAVPDVIGLISEIERWKEENRDGDAAYFDELFAVRCYFAMGRTAAAMEKLGQVEAVAAKFADPKKKLDAYCHIAELVAASDPVRARRLVDAAEKILAELTEGKRYPVRSLIYAHCAMGEHRQAVDLAFAAADDEAEAGAAMGYYEELGLVLTEKKVPEVLVDVQKRIRELRPRAKEIGVADRLEKGRIHALAAAGLPEEAAELFASRIAARAPGAEAIGDSITFSYIASSYLRQGRRADAIEWVKQARRQLPPEDRRWLALTAAKAGDFELAVSLLEKAEFGAPAQAATLAVLAHRAGKFVLRDELLEQARRGYEAAPDEVKKEDDVDVARERATVEALLGRFEPLVRLLPDRPGAEGMRLRALLILSVLQKQGKPVLYHGRDMLDSQFGLGG
jgi:tetratricopeptide (TPR) repeat protein